MLKKNQGFVSLSDVILFALITIYFLAFRNMPLVASFGIESANLFLLFFAPIFAFWASLLSFPERKKYFFAKFKNLFIRLSFFIGLACFYLFINEFRIQSCSPGKGFFPFLLMLLPPLLLNCCLGLAASFIRSKFLRLSLLTIFYASYAAIELLHWFKEPGFKIFTHFFIVLPSDVLTGISLDSGLVEFRVATIAFLLAFIGIFSFFSAEKKEKKYFLLLISCLCFAGGFEFNKTAYEFMGKTYKDLDKDYSLELKNNFITIRANPNFTSINDAQNILQEALIWQKRLEQRIGFNNSKEVTIWLHETNEQSFLYTGAKNVHFAIPFKRALHIVGTQVPHDTLGHELAHVFLGYFSNHIFKIIGSNLLIPNLSFTEGLAMALSPEESVEENIDLINKAQALYQSNIKIDIADLFSPYSIKFINTDTRIAYIYSGAFLSFCLRQSSNPQLLIKKMASLGSLKKVFEAQELINLIDGFNLKLTEEIPIFGLTWAKINFLKTQSILSRNCMDKYADDKEKFLHLISINKIDEAILISNHIPSSREKTLLLLKAAEKLSSKELFLLAEKIILHALKNENIEDKIIKNKFSFLMTKIYIEQQKYSQANQHLNVISQELLSPSLLRTTLVYKTFINEVLQTHSNHAQYALKFLTSSSKNYEKNLSLYSYYIRTEKHKIDSNAQLLNDYIFFKAQFNLENYSFAIGIGESIALQIDALENIFKEEFYFTLAKAYLAQKSLEKAKVLFSTLAQNTTVEAYKIKYTEYLERCIL